MTDKKTTKKKSAKKKTTKKTTKAVKGTDKKTKKATKKTSKKKKTSKAETTGETSPPENKDKSAAIKTEVKQKIVERISNLNDQYSLEDIFEAIRQIDFFKNDSDECEERNCDNPASTEGYCRLHYIKNWKEIKKKIKILEQGKLQELIESLVKKYSLKLIEMMLTDLTDEKSFFVVLEDMDIDSSDESFDDVDDDDRDMAYETKTGSKPVFED